MMSDDVSARLSLPLLRTGQAQKELTHNEALALLDMAVQPVVQMVGLDTPPTYPALGACWIVGSAPAGVWTGRARAIAGWTSGGWRYVAATAGMTAWSIGDAAAARFSGTAWVVGELRGRSVVLGGDAVLGPQRPPIANPAGGATVDAEGRAAVTAILVALRAHGLIAD